MLLPKHPPPPGLGGAAAPAEQGEVRARAGAPSPLESGEGRAVGGGWLGKASSARQPCSSRRSRGEEAGAGLSSRQRSAEVPKLLRSRSFTGRMEQPLRQTRRGEQAQVHSAFPSLSSRLSGQGVTPLLSVAPGIHVYKCVCIHMFYFALPGFFSPSDFADCRGEGLECVDSALPGMARTEMKRESQQGAGKATSSRSVAGSRGWRWARRQRGGSAPPFPNPSQLPPDRSSLLRFRVALVF